MKTQSRKKTLKEYNIYRSVSSSRLNKSVGVDLAIFSCKTQVVKLVGIHQTKAANKNMQNNFFLNCRTRSSFTI